MIIQAAVGTPIPGQIEKFNQFILMNLELASEFDIPTSVKVSSYGTPGVEISTMLLFADWDEHGEKTGQMRSHSKWKEIMDFGGQNEAFAQPIDSYVANLLPGFDSDVKFSDGPILATIWKPLPGKMGEMLATFMEGKSLHEPHGCRVRAFNIVGGRYAGSFAYNMSFADNKAYGRCMDNMAGDHAKLMAKIEANPNSELVAQFKMDNPVVVG